MKLETITVHPNYMILMGLAKDPVISISLGFHNGTFHETNFIGTLEQAKIKYVGQRIRRPRTPDVLCTSVLLVGD